jgi:hypothetical protein
MIRVMTLLLFLLSSLDLSAQLSTAQRELDFRTLAAIYARKYAPLDWKREAVGFDGRDLAAWLERVRNAGSDLEFLEICAEYVASFDDFHSYFRAPSTFIARLDFTVDVFDGKVLIETIARSALPVSQYPFAAGDELVSVDGKPVEEWIAIFSKLRRRGNPATTRRAAADLITFTPQSLYPRAVEFPDSAVIEVLRRDGPLETYTVPRRKTGYPVTNLGSSPDFHASVAPARATAPSYMELLEQMQSWRAPADDPLLQGETWSEEEAAYVPRRYLMGIGSTAPVFRPGFPPTYVQRFPLLHYSGVYEAEGRRIGYLRFPSFAPADRGFAVRELDAEIQYFEANTDGLVIDVTRNPGGGCYMADAAARLIPHDFYFFGEEIRVTLDRLIQAEAALRSAQSANADQWVIETYTNLLEELKRAWAEPGGARTGPVAACSQFGSGLPPSTQMSPAAAVYTKPLVILTDEFSSSAAEIFAAMLQDNGRGRVVGARTSGGGGAISAATSGIFSEAQTSATVTLILRREPVATPDFPATRYLENVGVRPDVEVEMMTRENLAGGYRAYVEAFTRALLDQIQ